VQARTYPLARSVWIYTNQGSGHPLDPRTREFLRFIFSREGQELVRQEGEYLPLTPALAAAQLKKLE
jgi:phosphate transport system substrate-binding protein